MLCRHEGRLGDPRLLALVRFLVGHAQTLCGFALTISGLWCLYRPQNGKRPRNGHNATAMRDLTSPMAAWYRVRVTCVFHRARTKGDAAHRSGSLVRCQVRRRLGSTRSHGVRRRSRQRATIRSRGLRCSRGRITVGSRAAAPAVSACCAVVHALAGSARSLCRSMQPRPGGGRRASWTCGARAGRRGPGNRRPAVGSGSSSSPAAQFIRACPRPAPAALGRLSLVGASSAIPASAWPARSSLSAA